MVDIILNYFEDHPVLQNLDKLTYSERQVAVMCLLHDNMTYIAEELGMHRTNVYTFKRNVIIKIRTHLTEEQRRYNGKSRM